jgi:SSS family solute:Na+ symporter
LAIGIGLVAFLVWEGRDPLWGINAGFLALAANFAVTWLVSLVVAEKTPHVAPSAGGNI